MQATPADPNTADFVTDEHKSAFTAYDPDAASAPLDEMGLADVDGDGFRERPASLKWFNVARWLPDHSHGSQPDALTIQPIIT